MIPTIIILAIAFYWLLRETDFMRVRLPVGKVADSGKVMPANIPQVNYKPSVFIPLDMPATTGNINIICMRQ